MTHQECGDDKEQSAAGRWLQLIPTILVAPCWPPDSSSTSPQLITLRLRLHASSTLNNRIFHFGSRPSQRQFQSTLDLGEHCGANEPWNNPFVMLNTLTLGVEVPTPDHLRVFCANSGGVESGANLSFPVEEDRNRREDCKMFSNFVVEIIVSL